MTTGTFILSYNPVSSKINGNQLLGWMKISKHVLSWYSPFAGTYVFKSDDDLVTITHSFSAAFDGELFMVSQVFPIAMNGALPTAIWHWVNGHETLGQPGSGLIEAP